MIKKIKFIIGKDNWIKYVLLMFMMLLAALIDTLLTYVIYPFVSLIQDETGDYDNIGIFQVFGIDDTSSIITFMAITIAVAYLLRNVFMLVLNKFKFRFLARSRAGVSDRLFSSFTSKKYSYFVESNTATIQRICVDDVIRVFRLLESILDLVVSLLTVLAILIVLAKSNIVLTILCVFFTGGLSVLINHLISGRIRKNSITHTNYYTSLLQVVQQFVGNIKAIIVTNKQKYFKENFKKNIDIVTEIGSENSFLSTMSGYITNAIVMCVVFGYMAVISNANVSLKEQLPVLALFALGAMKVMPCVASVAASVNNIRYNEIALEYVVDNLNKLNEDRGEIISNHSTNDMLKEEIIDIVVNNISFRFEDAQSDLFHNLTLQIPKRKMVAFVGSTGSGKTTLADIILGLQLPYKGNVFVNGRNIAEHREWWARQIGYIPQTIYLNESSIMENVAFGETVDLIDKDRVKESLRKACLLDFVEDMPQGLQTITGENGVKLSGGQRQRIGIARALYRNPSFLVLDEATSALDVETERSIMETINGLAGEMTMLIITHRLSTIERCDYVYRVENGKIELVSDSCYN